MQFDHVKCATLGALLFCAVLALIPTIAMAEILTLDCIPTPTTNRYPFHAVIDLSAGTVTYQFKMEGSEPEYSRVSITAGVIWWPEDFMSREYRLDRRTMHLTMTAQQNFSNNRFVAGEFECR
jgi:hypothetical protein